jgi:hypothetical protein
MLALADRLVRGEIDRGDAEAPTIRFAAEVEDLEDPSFAPGMVGDAAVHTVSGALVDYGPDDFEPETLDEELDADQWDASFYAALAAAGFGPREPGDDARSQERRRAFWDWYLSEAVPAAFHGGA